MAMWKPWEWSRTINEQAVANARAATVDCSRRRVERAEVELFLRQLADTAVALTAARAGTSRHPA